MIVDPYKRNPAPPEVAVLLQDERQGYIVVGEHGDRLELDHLPAGVRVWGSYDVVHQLVADGYGEALCWNNEEIRWRHERFEPDWRLRATDVSVLKLPFPDDPADTLQALAAWRDWLARYGAAPTGTTGSAAWSLLRARLERRLWTTVGHPPPLRATLGGRQELGPFGRGSFAGQLDHFDMPAAYANEIGHLPYGGFWQTGKDLPVQRDPDWWAQEGRPVFVRAIVRIPGDLPYGPLPRRPRKRVPGIGAVLLGADYPRGRMQGVWCWQEVEQALAHGTQLVKVLDVWVHLAAGRPFLPWWDALQDGRTMQGLSGLLAKTTGNALWGRFCMDGRGGVRTIRGQANGRGLVQRPAPVRGGLPAAHDLAETVSGRVRSRLYAAMEQAGPRLLSAHTDGIWTREAGLGPADWRLKEQARQLDILDPQVLRYWPRPAAPDEPWHVFAGMPAELAPARFEELWAAAAL